MEIFFLGRWKRRARDNAAMSCLRHVRVDDDFGAGNFFLSGKFFTAVSNDNSGLAELSDGVKSASTSSDGTNSSTTPTRTDSMSDDTGFP